ncbi:MAG: hypothetical protein IPO05_16285, partial [Flavobacteriales bacterium]|nr:hypothetical protein [Flavobacteriales bacterium]
VPVEEGTDLISVRGFVGKPEFAKRSRGEQYFFVNQRYIRSNYLEHAVRKAYDELVTRENHPSWFLYIDGLDLAQIGMGIRQTKPARSSSVTTAWSMPSSMPPCAVR